MDVLDISVTWGCCSKQHQGIPHTCLDSPYHTQFLAVHHVVVPESVFHSLVPLEVSHKRVPDQLNLGNTPVPSTPTLVNKLVGIVNFLEGSTEGNLFGFLKHKLTLVPLYQLTSTPQTWTLGA